MANSQSVGRFYLDSFGEGKIASVTSTKLNTAGNSVVSLPILSGGLTKGTNAASSGSVIIRRVSVVNPTGSLASANISITTSNDGNTSNAVVASTVLSGVTGVNTYQDLSVSGGITCVSGFNTQALYVNVNTASGNNNTADIRVYGDVVTF